MRASVRLMKSVQKVTLNFINIKSLKLLTKIEKQLLRIIIEYTTIELS